MTYDDDGSIFEGGIEKGFMYEKSEFKIFL